VAEDHQTKNAMALVNKQAALFVKDAEAADKLLALAIKTVEDDNKLEELSKNIKKLGLTDSADRIADEVLNIARK
jgi:UDP-N-acetylglucosamine--N-acetylmuramyl-(pentapeptide) pyrophosphoryl-undecaprenol N-acetylglucosamine transferase